MLTTRRQAIKTLTAAAIASTTLGRFSAFAQTAATTTAPAAPTGPFTLPPLPYAYDALEPSIDTATMHLHHDKHHKAYVNKLNEAVAKLKENMQLMGVQNGNVDELLKDFASVPEFIRTAVRNNGGGHSNHSLFWQTLSAKGGAPKGTFAQALTDDVGGMDKLKAEMSEQGGKLFGSGWVWLVLDGGKKLTILTLPNQDSPLMEGHYPLFGIDVWEHAYYLKYHNVRADYITAIWNVVNWDFISDRYAAAMKG